MKRIFALIITILLILTACADSSGELSPPIWSVKAPDGGEIIVLGSIHVGDERMSPLPDYILSALEESDALAVEADVLAAMSKPASLMSAMKQMTYSDGTTIKDHLPPELYEKTRSALEDAGLYNAAMELYKPVMWMSTLDTLMYEELGLDEDAGVDMQLLELAHESGREIIEIESVEAQYMMLGSFSDELQEMLLESSYESMSSDEAKESLRAMLDAWCSGDIEALEASVTADTADAENEEEAALLEEYNNALIHDRNLLMSDYAEEALKSGKRVLVCVGAAHVIGDTGILAALEARGYTVERLH